MLRMTETWHYLFIAVLALAAGSETLPERLARAYEAGLQRLFAAHDWPAVVQDDIAELKTQLKQIVPIGVPGVSLDKIKAAFVDADPILVRSVARRTVLLYRKLVEETSRC